MCYWGDRQGCLGQEPLTRMPAEARLHAARCTFRLVHLACVCEDTGMVRVCTRLIALTRKNRPEVCKRLE